MRPLLLILPLMIFCLVACAHEAENTGVENSSVFVLPVTSHAFEMPVSENISSSPDHASYVPGKISRFQRNVIAIDDSSPKSPMPSAQYFDDVMDHLEMLMADEIRKNNEIAALQEQIPGYEF